MNQTDILAPQEWHALLDVIQEEKGISILLGATDTGKSTLARFLIFNLCRQGLKVALVDADIGQSFLGPPATIGFSVFKSDPNWQLILSPPEIFFVGSITPEGHFPIHLKGVKRMVDKATSYGVDVILVDTTGFVLGDGGKELKRRKIDLLSPRLILALQRSDELESILDQYQEGVPPRIIRLPLSEQVRPRSMEERRIYRTDKFQEYFKHSVVQELAVEEFKIEGEVIDPNGEVLPLDWALRINGLLIGLKDGSDETLALGLIKNSLPEKKIVRVSTPLREIERSKTIQLSSLKVLPLHENEF
ncbi:MAG TPA: Clp1/GlmU family protein [Thermodesulfobacteriota bacterium]|nr:Clp1/GlmU family protein [Thermodesulfobacteriota bacterium]